MQKRETQREEASRRGVSKSTIFRERKAQNAIDKLGEDCPIVYVWRYSGDDTCAKIGKSGKMSLLESRMVTTYHPTDDPVLIGIMPCRSSEEAADNEDYFLNTLERTRPDREWVIIDEEFNRIIDEAFISDPSELYKLFGKQIKTEKSYNENS